MTTRKLALASAALLLALAGAEARAAVRGRALLVDAKTRTEPGDLLLCTLAGTERKFDTLVEGQVVSARFSPDGRKIVYLQDGKIRVMDLATRKSRDVGTCAAKLTYVNWGTGEKIYYSDGKDLTEIFCLDMKTGQKRQIHKGNKGRSTVSLDGRKAAWVIPPVAGLVGGKQFRYMGGCGGAVSPSGNYLTSNLTTSHKLMGIFTFGADGPSAKPIATVTAPDKYAFNGFYFGRDDSWVCYVLEHPKNVSPTSYICFWRTGEHIRISEFGKYCIKDFFDETDVVPDGATLQRISVCAEGPANTPLENETVNVGLTKRLKIVGHYSKGGAEYTPQLREGVSWQVDKSKLAVDPSSYKGVATAGSVTVTASYKGKSDSFKVTVLPELTGDGFKAEIFKDAEFKSPALTRVDPYIDFRWTGRTAPDESVDGRKPWAVRWTGQVNVQTAGEYTFYFLQGEGNDRWLRKDKQWVTGKDGQKISCWAVRVDGKLLLHREGRKSNYPWAKPQASKPVKLTAGMHAVEVTCIDDKAPHPVVAQLYWSGPGIRQSLLGGGYVHSNGKPAK